MHLPASILIIRVYIRPEIARSFLRIGLRYPWSTLKQFEVQNFRFFLVDRPTYQVSMLYESFIGTRKNLRKSNQKRRESRKNSGAYKCTQIRIFLGCKSRLLIVTRKRLQSLDAKTNKNMLHIDCRRF